MANDAFKFSGEAALNYDQYLGPFLFEPYAIELVSKLETQDVSSVLELAAGTGRVTRHIRDRFAPAVRFVASDFNPDMLQVAKNKTYSKAIEFSIEDAQNLSFPDNSFDLVVCQFGLMFLKDKKKGLNEAMRVLKPGGTFIFSTWDKTENTPLLKLVFNDVVLPFLNDDDPARLQVPFSLFDTKVLQTWMEETNFKAVKTEKVLLQLQWPSAKEVVKAYFIKHSIGAEVIAKDPDAFNDLAAEIEDRILKQFGDGEVKANFTAFFVSGKKM